MNNGEQPVVNSPESARLFQTTHWSIIRRAKDDSATALNHLFTQYRQPMIVHLIGKGRNRDEAEELVQGFCAQLLKRDFLANVAQTKGKFRTFLLTALNHHFLDWLDQVGTIKRGQGKVPESLDELDEEGCPLYSPVAPGNIADREYDKAWARTVLQNSLRRLEEESTIAGRAALCQALEPALFEDETSPSYRDIAIRLGMTEGSVKVAAHRLRQRLSGLIREEIMQTVSDEAQFQEELAYLISLFGNFEAKV